MSDEESEEEDWDKCDQETSKDKSKSTKKSFKLFSKQTEVQHRVCRAVYPQNGGDLWQARGM